MKSNKPFFTNFEAGVMKIHVEVKHNLHPTESHEASRINASNRPNHLVARM